MSSGHIDELEELLRLDPGEALRTHANPVRERLERVGSRVVLVGAGPLGKVAMAACRKAGLEPVAFADNDPRKKGTILGLPVMTPETAVEQHGGAVCFIVTVFTSEALRAQLQGLGVEPISYAELTWAFSEVLLPYLALDTPATVVGCAEQVRQGFDTWSDERSRAEYLAQIRWRMRMEPVVLGGQDSPKDILFAPDLVTLREDESFVDCGAFDGDTLHKFLEVSGGKFGALIAFEPDRVNFGKLQTLVEGLPVEEQKKAHLYPNALGSRAGRVQFAATGTVSSAVGAGEEWVEVVTLDETAAIYAPTFIKMDIEGAELEAIKGGSETIRRQKPIMAICLYHATQHLWEVPLLLKELVPEYDLFLRRYSNDCWELVCYAIPAHRLPAP